MFSCFYLRYRTPEPRPFRFPPLDTKVSRWTRVNTASKDHIYSSSRATKIRFTLHNTLANSGSLTERLFLHHIHLISLLMVIFDRLYILFNSWNTFKEPIQIIKSLYFTCQKVITAPTLWLTGCFCIKLTWFPSWWLYLTDYNQASHFYLLKCLFGRPCHPSSFQPYFPFESSLFIQSLKK